jgi:hypothetical protein
MSTQMIIFIALKMLFGFSLAFLAILSWAKTRESAWILIIAGSLLRYVELIYSILEELEILSPSWGSMGDVSVLNILLTILPLAFLTVGFLMFLIKKKKF